MTSPLEKEFADLAKVGTHEKTFNRFGKTFKFRSLTAEQNLECLSSITTTDDFARVTQLGQLLLAKSLVEVSGHPIDSDECMKFLSKMQKIVIDELSSCYEELRDEQEQLVEKQFGKQTKELREKQQTDGSKSE